MDERASKVRCPALGAVGRARGRQKAGKQRAKSQLSADVNAAEDWSMDAAMDLWMKSVQMAPDAWCSMRRGSALHERGEGSCWRGLRYEL